MENRTEAETIGFLAEARDVLKNGAKATGRFIH
jgi:hypothetical protein